MCGCLSLEGSDTLKAKNSSSHLMHLQVGVRGPHLGIQGISSVVFQTATLLQVGLELLSAPPKEKEKKDDAQVEFISGEL